MDVLTPADIQYEYTVASEEKRVSISSILKSGAYLLATKQGHMAIPENEEETVEMLASMVLFVEKEHGSLLMRKFFGSVQKLYDEEG